MIHHDLHQAHTAPTMSDTGLMKHLTTDNRHDPSLCRVGLVVSVSAYHTVGHEFASRPGHTKDDHKNGTNCLPA